MTISDFMPRTEIFRQLLSVFANLCSGPTGKLQARSLPQGFAGFHHLTVGHCLATGE